MKYLSLKFILNAIIGKSLWKQQGVPQEASKILKEPQGSSVSLLESKKASKSLKELSKSLSEPQGVSIASD